MAENVNILVQDYQAENVYFHPLPGPVPGPEPLQVPHTYANPPVENIILLRTQIELLESLVYQINAAANQANLRLNELYLPEFDPDNDHLTIDEWCQQVDSLITLRRCPDMTALMKALSCLRGRAKIWADCNAHNYATWDMFRGVLFAHFAGENRHIDHVDKFKEYTSNNATTYSEYVTKAWRLFKRISPGAPIELMVVAVISGIRPKLYQAELLQSAPRSEAELIAKLNNYRKISFDSDVVVSGENPRSHASSQYETMEPRTRNEPRKRNIHCYRCGKRGHYARQCPQIFCNFCKNTTHSTENCWSRRSAPRTSCIRPTRPTDDFAQPTASTSDQNNQP